MRRILWNLYAWPISVLILLGFVFELSTLKVLSAVDVALSLPALLALHLHVWDVKFLSPVLWKSFAFVYLAWDLYYNLAINPMQFGKPGLLFVPVFSLPLYVALFRYALRNWSCAGGNSLRASSGAQRPIVSPPPSPISRTLSL